MTKLTDWFPPEIKPVHTGQYEVWTDECGGWGCSEPHKVIFRGSWKWKESDFFPPPKVVRWRGLANNPKKGKK